MAKTKEEAAAGLHLAAGYLERLPAHDETTPDGKDFTPLAKRLRKQSAAMHALAEKHAPSR